MAEEVIKPQIIESEIAITKEEEGSPEILAWTLERQRTNLGKLLITEFENSFSDRFFVRYSKERKVRHNSFVLSNMRIVVQPMPSKADLLKVLLYQSITAKKPEEITDIEANLVFEISRDPFFQKLLRS